MAHIRGRQGRVGGRGGWAARCRLCLSLEQLRVQDVPAICRDKPRGLERCFTNTGVNFRLMLSI